MLPVLDLDPAPEPAGAIEAVAMLRDQPFETHQAGVAEQGRANLALLEVGEGGCRRRGGPAGAPGWSCASAAAGFGDPRRRPPGRRRRRTRPRHPDSELS